MEGRPIGLQTETIESAMRRADSVSRPNGKSYSGVMCRNKDLRHVVLMVHECRGLRADLTAEQSLRAAAEGEVNRQSNRIVELETEEALWLPQYQGLRADLEMAEGEVERLQEALERIAGSTMSMYLNKDHMLISLLADANRTLETKEPAKPKYHDECNHCANAFSSCPVDACRLYRSDGEDSPCDNFAAIPTKEPK